MKSVKQIIALLVMICMVFCTPAMSFGATETAKSAPVSARGGNVSGDAEVGDVSGDADEEDEYIEDEGDVSGDADRELGDPYSGIFFDYDHEYIDAFEGDEVDITPAWNQAYKMVGEAIWERLDWDDEGNAVYTTVGHGLEFSVVAEGFSEYRCTATGERNGEQLTEQINISVCTDIIRYETDEEFYADPLANKEVDMGVKAVEGATLKWEEEIKDEEGEDVLVDMQCSDTHLRVVPTHGYHKYVCTATITDEEGEESRSELSFFVNCEMIDNHYIDCQDFANYGEDYTVRAYTELNPAMKSQPEISYKWYVTKPTCSVIPEDCAFGGEYYPEDDEFVLQPESSDEFTMKAMKKSTFVKCVTTTKSGNIEESVTSMGYVLVSSPADENPTVDKPVTMASTDGLKTFDFIPQQTGYYRFSVSEVTGGALPVLGYSVDGDWKYRSTNLSGDGEDDEYGPEDEEGSDNGEGGDLEEDDDMPDDEGSNQALVVANAYGENDGEDAGGSAPEYPTVVLKLYAGQTYSFYAIDSNSDPEEDAAYSINVELDETYVCEHDATLVYSVKAPTCTEAGYTKSKVCQDCGEIIVPKEVIEPLGHKAKNQNIKAKCNKHGTTGRTVCSRCGIVLTEGEETPFTDHTFGDWKTEGRKTVRKCTVCGFTQTRATPTIKLSASTFKYTGKPQLPGVTVSVDGKVLTEDDYSIEYGLGSTKVGTYTVEVVLKNAYAGIGTANYVINPKGISLSKVSPAKKSFKATWKKQTAETTGYQIRYSLKSSMSGAKTVTVTKNSTTSKTVKKLKAKKKYYVQIRTYKTVSGKKYYSAWSAKKTVKTKK